MRILLIYHFFHPDTVVSARLFSDLAEDLVRAGHEVRVFTCNRTIRDKGSLPGSEQWHGVQISRFSRPALAQGSNLGRLFNSAILQVKWLRAFRRIRKETDAVILGTDPQFSYLLFPWFRLLSPKALLIHWCFDLYPEALSATGRWWMKLPAFFLRPFARFSYRFVDIMADLGPRMRERLQRYRSRCRHVTLTPWALVEPETIPPADPAVREALFGKAKIALLYSGTVGEAHDIAPFIALARECRKAGIDAAFCFAGYGNRYQEQTAAITAEDTNIRLAGFASEQELEKRLSAADIHMISLRPEWGGIVLPSKSFGALAIGRPLLYNGAIPGDLGNWIDEFHTGWNFETSKMADMVKVLKELSEDPERMTAYRQAAYACYHTHFSRRAVTELWENLLR